MRKSFFAGATIAAALLASFPAFASDISISHAWTKESIGRVPNGAAFFNVENVGPEDRIIGATSDISDRTELHTHIMEGNVMKMRQVDGVAVPAHGAVAFKPGSYHVMFLGLHDPLKAGEHIKFTLEFEKAGNIPVEAEVVTLDEAAKMTKAAKMDMNMKHGMKGKMDHSGSMGKMKN